MYVATTRCTGPARRRAADAQGSPAARFSSYLRVFGRHIGLLWQQFEPSEVPRMRTKAN